MVSGFFRKHWSGLGVIGKTFTFGTSSLLIFDTNLFGVAGDDVQSQMVFNVWVKPQQTWGTGGHYIIHTPGLASIFLESTSGQIGVNINGFGVSSGTVAVNYNQWNHILISAQRSNSLVTFGSSSGGWNSGTNTWTGLGSAYAHRFHMVVNGTAYHRYVQANSSPSVEDGFIKNDFATGSSGTAATYGNFFPTTGGDELFTSEQTTDSATAFYSGSQYVNYFVGQMYQFYLDNKYYDMTDTSNIDKFRYSNTYVPTLPMPTKVWLVGGDHFNLGTNQSSVSNSNVNTTGDPPII
mgnify:FL=1